jgi:hypothetical protein
VDIRNADSSHTSELEVPTVILNLEHFHDCLDSRRAVVIQHAANLYAVEPVPAIAALNAGEQTIRIAFPDVLAATEDFDNSPIVPGIIANGVIKLDPDTITPEGLELLEVAFRCQELLMGEDQAVHLSHICIQLKLEQLFVCMDEQPEVYVTDNNFLALTACLLDHDRSRGNLLQFCLHRLHSVGLKPVARCPRKPRYFLEEPRHCTSQGTACRSS